MATIDILGVSHSYELTAPTENPHVLVFIHGWLLSRQYWLPLIQDLSSEFQCLSYDLRGFGDSASMPCKPQPVLQPLNANHDRLSSNASTASTSGSLDYLLLMPQETSELDSGSESSAAKYTPANYAQDLALLLQKLNIKSAWLVGHSLGASIALWGADQLSHCVQGVVCINAGGGIYLKEEFERFRTVGQKILQFRPCWLAQLPLMDLLFSRVNVAQPIKRSWGRQRVVDFVNAHPEAALGALLDSTTPEEVHLLPQVVARLQQPVYFIAGEQDEVMEPKYVHHLASFHPLFQAGEDIVIEIPQCGHMGMIEQTSAIATQLRIILNQYL